MGARCLLSGAAALCGACGPSVFGRRGCRRDGRAHGTISSILPLGAPDRRSRSMRCLRISSRCCSASASARSACSSSAGATDSSALPCSFCVARPRRAASSRVRAASAFSEASRDARVFSSTVARYLRRVFSRQKFLLAILRSGGGKGGLPRRRLGIHIGERPPQNSVDSALLRARSSGRTSVVRMVCPLVSVTTN
jgi:hypothetical protein